MSQITGHSYAPDEVRDRVNDILSGRAAGFVLVLDAKGTIDHCSGTTCFALAGALAEYAAQLIRYGLDGGDEPPEEQR